MASDSIRKRRAARVRATVAVWTANGGLATDRGARRGGRIFDSSAILRNFARRGLTIHSASMSAALLASQFLRQRPVKRRLTGSP